MDTTKINKWLDAIIQDENLGLGSLKTIEMIKKELSRAEPIIQPDTEEAKRRLDLFGHPRLPEYMKAEGPGPVEACDKCEGRGKNRMGNDCSYCSGFGFKPIEPGGVVKMTTGKTDFQIAWELTQTKDKPFYVDTVRKLIRSYNLENISLSKLVEEFNVAAVKWKDKQAEARGPEEDVEIRKDGLRIACSSHKQDKLSYLAAHEDAERRIGNGEQQRQCPVCKLWLWNHEF